jgi:hypothetical protein
VLERLGPDGAADVVDQDVEAAEGFHRTGHDPGAIGVLFQVGGEGEHALASQFVDQLGTVYRHHLRAFSLQPPAHAPADALSGTGDQGDLALESVVHMQISSSRETLWQQLSCSKPERLRDHCGSGLAREHGRSPCHPPRSLLRGLARSHRVGVLL